VATNARYFDLVREMKDAYNHRLRLITITGPTVRKWLRPFQQRGPSGLVALSRARHTKLIKLLR